MEEQQWKPFRSVQRADRKIPASDDLPLTSVDSTRRGARPLAGEVPSRIYCGRSGYASA